MSRKTRAWLYRVLTAAAPIAGAYGVVSNQEAALWVAFAGAVLGVGVAAVNTPTHGDEPEPHKEQQ